MDITLLQVLIVCPLVFMAGFVDAVAGGGGLISLPAYMIAGLPVHQSIGTNKLSSSMGTLLATLRYAKNGYVPVKIASICVITAFMGGSTGASLALLVEEHLFKIIMLFLLPATALYVMRGKSLNNTESMQYSAGKTLIIGMIASFVIGVYDGFYGPGTGTFLILLLTGWAKMGLRQANGMTKVINLTTNVSSLVIYLLNAKVLIPLGLLAGIFSIAGNYAGTRFFDQSGAKAVRPLMILVIGIFFVKIIMELL